MKRPALNSFFFATHVLKKYADVNKKGAYILFTK